MEAGIACKRSHVICRNVIKGNEGRIVVTMYVCHVMQRVGVGLTFEIKLLDVFQRVVDKV